MKIAKAVAGVIRDTMPNQKSSLLGRKNRTPFEEFIDLPQKRSIGSQLIHYTFLVSDLFQNAL